MASIQIKADKVINAAVPYIAKFFETSNHKDSELNDYEQVRRIKELAMYEFVTKTPPNRGCKSGLCDGKMKYIGYVGYVEDIKILQFVCMKCGYEYGFARKSDEIVHPIPTITINHNDYELIGEYL